MIRDGCVMKITKSLSRAPLKSGAPVRGVCAEGRVCNEREEEQPTHTADTHTGLHAVTSSHTSVCQSLVSLRTVLSSITTPHCGHTLTVTHASHPDTPITHASRLDTPITHASCLDTPASDCPRDFVLTEFGESGSYDDVILEDFSENVPHDSAPPVCKTKPHPLNSNPPCSIKDPIRSLKGFGTRTTPTIPFSIYSDQSHQSSSSSSSCSVFHAPPSVLSSSVNQSARPAVAISQSACCSIPINQSKLSSVSVNQSACSYYSINQSHNSISPNQSALSYICVNQSAHSSFSINQTRPSCPVNQSSLSSSSKQLPLPPPRGRATVTSCFANKSSSTSLNQSAPSSLSINQSCLSSVSANQSAFSTSSCKQLPLPPPRGGLKITAPLCDCGRRSRRLTVCNGGPNHGRAFYTCAGRRSSGPAPRDSTHPGYTNRRNGCGFFKWESALIKSSAFSRNASALSFNLSTATSRNFR
ncbi:hypothetical protein AMELA_G00235590 [Ameiurus melas]|uniref:GRF-type domain-containing protein n=1 Tax=Ameiurus melas TaxID=219545 RepID=A0A7J6A0T6_AMEME|nr:hypothetical protein AMELA_G00235590 [Ameiurus melas]